MFHLLDTANALWAERGLHVDDLHKFKIHLMQLRRGWSGSDVKCGCLLCLLGSWMEQDWDDLLDDLQQEFIIQQRNVSWSSIPLSVNLLTSFLTCPHHDMYILSGSFNVSSFVNVFNGIGNKTVRWLNNKTKKALGFDWSKRVWSLEIERNTSLIGNKIAVIASTLTFSRAFHGRRSDPFFSLYLLFSSLSDNHVKRIKSENYWISCLHGPPLWFNFFFSSSPFFDGVERLWSGMERETLSLKPKYLNGSSAAPHCPR